MYEDIIDINVDTGKISITEKAGDDVVRFVDDKGKVKDSYTYGENGSFRKDFKHTETKVGAVPINELRTDNVKQADKLFEKISQNSNIEWEHMVISHKSGWHDFAVLGNTGRFFKDGQS